jgi:hypothetical protein
MNRATPVQQAPAVPHVLTPIQLAILLTGTEIL